MEMPMGARQSLTEPRCQQKVNPPKAGFLRWGRKAGLRRMASMAGRRP
jgi:hypothetical protein